jgi:protein-S-isoprenylcysteine O-methyltransferase Ste14
MLKNELARKGQWLFRTRAYLPVVLLPLFLVELYRNRDRLAELPPLDRWWAAGCMSVASVGLLIRFLTVGYAARGTSGRNTERQKANTLNTTGFYSLTRNSLYFGNLVITLAIMASTRSWELTAITFLLFLLYYERIIFAEEKYLEQKFGDTYRRWAASTPCFWPRLRGWVRPALPFSWRRAIRGEYSTVFGITTSLAIAEHARWYARSHTVEVNPFWAIVFAVGGTLFVICRTLKKRTRLLKA